MTYHAQGAATDGDQTNDATCHFGQDEELEKLPLMVNANLSLKSFGSSYFFFCLRQSLDCCIALLLISAIGLVLAFLVPENLHVVKCDTDLCRPSYQICHHGQTLWESFQGMLLSCHE